MGFLRIILIQKIPPINEQDSEDWMDWQDGLWDF
jgi:hypothetical protein